MKKITQIISILAKLAEFSRGSERLPEKQHFFVQYLIRAGMNEILTPMNGFSRTVQILS